MHSIRPKTLPLAAAFAALAGLTLPLAAQAVPAPAPASAPAVKSQLESRYTQLKAAMESRSAPRILAMLTPDFASTQLSGRTIDARTMIAELSHVPTDPNRKTQTTLDHLTIDGDIAHVTQTMTASAQVKGHTMKLIALSQDTWQKGSDGWRLKTTVSQDMTVTQDGKVIRHAHIGDAAVRREAAGPAAGPAKGR